MHQSVSLINFNDYVIFFEIKLCLEVCQKI